MEGGAEGNRSSRVEEKGIAGSGKNMCIMEKNGGQAVKREDRYTGTGAVGKSGGSLEPRWKERATVFRSRRGGDNVHAKQGQRQRTAMMKKWLLSEKGRADFSKW